MHRRKVSYTSALCVHMKDEMRILVEAYADRERISLGAAGRTLIEAGAQALGIMEAT